MPAGLLLSDDLIDASRVTATGRADGCTVRHLRHFAGLLQALAEGGVAGVIVDLHHAELDLTRLLASLEGLEPRPAVIGFGSHVDAARLKNARQAGLTRVMPRSQFFEELPAGLKEWLGG